jgi:hypothetical protein
MENKLLKDIAEYIEEHYWYSDRHNKIREQFKDVRFSVSVINKESWSERLKNKFDFIFAHMEDTLTQRLWKVIKQKGLSDVDVYKRANLDRRLFSKMRKEKSYKPSKNTALAIVIALELDKAAADDLLSRAGFALSGGNKDDVIIRYFIEHKQYDINIINEVLDYYGFPILGERKS